MKEPLMRMGKSQMRVPSNRSSEMRLHLNRVGTAANCSRVEVGSLEVFAKQNTAEPQGEQPCSSAVIENPEAVLLLVKDEGRVGRAAAAALTVHSSSQNLAI